MASNVPDSRWKTRLMRTADSSPYYDWLVHVGSLTERLRRSCRRFEVNLLRQELARPCPDETAALGLRLGRRAWVREVTLLCAGRPVVFAHSVLPPPGLRSGWHLVGGLGERPLGALLFSDPLIERTPFAFLRLDPRHPLYAAAARIAGHATETFWARRSAFCRNRAPILVTEVFLPDIIELAA